MGFISQFLDSTDSITVITEPLKLTDAVGEDDLSARRGIIPSGGRAVSHGPPFALPPTCKSYEKSKRSLQSEGQLSFTCVGYVIQILRSCNI